MLLPPTMSSLELIVHKAKTIEWHPGALHRNKPPNLYVEVSHNDHRILKTKALGRNLNPLWDSSLVFTSHVSSEILAFRLFHDTLGPDICVGKANASVQDLIEQSSSEQGVYLDINGSRGNFHLHVSLKVLTAQEAVAQVTEDISKLTISSKIEKILDPIDAMESVGSTGNFLKSLNAVLSALENIVKVGDELAKVHPYANAAWKLLTSVYKITKHQQEVDEKVVKLVEAMANLYSFATEADLLVKKSKNAEESVQNIAKQTLECALFIRDYLGKGFLARGAQNFLLRAGQRIDEMTTTLLELKDTFDRGITVQGAVMTAQILDKVQTLETQRILGQLRHTGAGSLLHCECLAGTRVKIIADITEQLMTQSKTPIIWLSGVAGSGKSTIATSVSEYFRVLGRLGAWIRFARNDVGRSDPIVVLHTIVWGLANAHPYMEQAICKALSQDSHLVEAPIEKQFQELLLQPLGTVKENIIGPFIVIIDALDECAQETRRAMIHLIANFFSKLPMTIRCLITSRPDADIARGFCNVNSVAKKSLVTESEDISLYVRNRLYKIQQEHNLEFSWPKPEKTNRLMSLSGTLFIWAVTALNLVEGAFQPSNHLDTLLETSFNEGSLDELYTLALMSNGYWNDPKFKESATFILATIALCRFPLTDTAIGAILGLEDGLTAQILTYFGAVIQWSPGGPAQTLHASFGDFLLHSAGKKNPWFFESAGANKILTSGCLTLLQKCLKFNIYNFPDSHLLNSEVPELAASNLAPGLIYASRFWGSHLAETEFDEEVITLLDSFLKHQFLFWLEILSVEQDIQAAGMALQVAQSYVDGQNNWCEIFLKDAQKFVSVFAPGIGQSAPHIYTSALPLTPKESIVRRHFLALFPHLLQYSVPNSWVKLEKVLWGHTELVNSVAFSPNGEWIVSGSVDNTLRMWEASSGADFGQPLQGHTESVTSVAFSPDGQHIVSGSEDKTVRIWEASSGAPGADPLKGHTSTVTSVAFSPDGQHIVSGSFDKTVRIWDASTGAPSGDPLQGHTDCVTNVAFSPDGQHIVSGSGDNTVRIWDAGTGAPIGEPLQGHTDWVNSVAFSQDGHHIVSGSDDNTVRIWDAGTGAPIGDPLHGHTHYVRCVAFSPDGRHIVSGSDDKTVRIWDAGTGATIGDPLQGHTDYSVTSVVFSPDGQHIVSGSGDNTVRIWDASTGAPSGDPLQGHTDWVTNVAFSPDGQHIVSGSYDNTVRIWDAGTGAPIGDPLQGHTDYVRCVAFSSDGQHIVSGSDDKTLRIWDAGTGAPVGDPLQGHTHSVTSVAFSPDGQHIVSGSFDKTVRIWDASTGAPSGDPLQGHTDCVTNVAFSPDGQHIVSGSGDNTVRIWDAGTGAPIGDPLQGHTARVECVAFSPGGQHIVSGSLDKTLQIWDAVTGAPVADPLQGHTHSVNSVAFSPNGQHIVSGSYDKTVRVWNLGIGAAESEHINNPLILLSSQPFLSPGTFENGWISSSSSRLIWVPGFLQSDFCVPWCKFVISQQGVMVLDLSKFVHGTEWAKCIRNK
ncbi:WD40 repeat-like protein [Favolaschia claudopus]|uniref:WD40 repeat-like protein n=1 Tax=Favolaschia claudopus TaxID=2862362 RepID=A0AAW0BYF2_9AGAR